MNHQLIEWLQQVQSGELTPSEAERSIREMQRKQAVQAELGFATLDLVREQRTGFPEVVFGEGKTAHQITAIFRKFMDHVDRVMATRVEPVKAQEIIGNIPEITYHETARMLTWFRHPILRVREGYVAVVCAGTSDLPVAEEAAITLECMGSHVERVYDVGVAGIHRLFARLHLIREATVIVVVAGMEGALASVIGGLVDKPIIAVPTSIGYGASFHGVSALLTMLNSCAPGISVVNIDNGFGGGYNAGIIHKQIVKE
jgi:NCAIR mutase (PurE)-related protein